MMRNGSKQYSVGDRPTLYLGKKTPEPMLELINEQSDLTLFYMHAMELYYEKYGVTDCEDILPRKYEFLKNMAPAQRKEEPTSVHEPVPNPGKIEDYQEQAASVESTEVYQEPLDEQSGNDESQEEIEQQPIEKTKEEKVDNTWGSIALNDDPYA